MKGHVFLSYVREDAAEVACLQEALEAAGVPVWRDTKSLWPGDTWPTKIKQAISKEALAFVACFSHRSQSKAKSYQRKELSLAAEEAAQRQWDRTWLIPVRFSDCQIPPLDVGHGRMLGDLQIGDLFGPQREENTRSLITVVKRILATADDHVVGWHEGLARLPVHAIEHRRHDQIDWPITVPRQQLRSVRLDGVVTSICAVPAGAEMLLASSAFGAIHLWDPGTGDLRREIPTGRLGPVQSLCVVQAGADVLLVAGDSQGVVQLWDPVTGDTHGSPRQGHSGGVQAVCSVRVGNSALVASGGDDGTVRLWDPTTAAPIDEPLVGHTKLVRALAAVPVGNRSLLASGGHDGTIRLWDPVTGQPYGDPLAGPEQSEGIYGLCVLPVNEQLLLAAACGDALVRLWDPETGQQQGEPLSGHAQLLLALCAFPAGDRWLIASAGHGESVRLWDPLLAGTAGVPLSGHTGWVTSLCAVPLDQQLLLASGSIDGTLRLWGPAVTAEGASQLPPSRPQPQNLLEEVPLAAIATGTHTRIRWPETAYEQDIRVLRGHTNTLQGVCSVPAGNEVLVASASIDGTVRLWDPATGKRRGEPLTGHDGTVHDLSPVTVRHRGLLASGGFDGTVRLWDPTTATATGMVLETGSVFALCALSRQDHAVLAVGDQDGTIQLWDPATGDPAGRPMTGHEGWVSSMCAVALGNRTLLASASSDKTVRLWDPATGQAWRPPFKRGWLRKSHDDWVHAVSAVPVEGRTLIASAGADRVIRLWDPTTGRPVGDPLTGHTDSVLALCTVPFGQRMLVASAGWDASVRLWDPATGQPHGDRPLTGHSEAVNAICAVPTGDHLLLATSSHDRTVRLWGPASGQPNLNAVLDDVADTSTGDGSVFSRRMEAALKLTGGRAYLGGDILAWLAAFGRFKIDPDHSDAGDDEVWPTIAAMHHIWKEKPRQLIAGLAEVVLPEGGWAVYGAHKLTEEIIDSYIDGVGRQDPNYLRIFTEGIAYAQSQGYSRWHMSSWEANLLADLRSRDD